MAWSGLVYLALLALKLARLIHVTSGHVRFRKISLRRETPQRSASYRNRDSFQIYEQARTLINFIGGVRLKPRYGPLSSVYRQG